ncbi:aldolase [Micromonospora globispora]|uniref:class II aldolase/adducin family protein n=1 Tax=Micromonospora globispora TaxID=1450148 RepID=UPI000D6ED642|nr:class II aldolase/adducin family protein [Micromonospora globispora]PWU55399.1 aldolase [Micromonospora globispora]RQW91798.1 aldolase [Micromonospora globispora]
MTNPDRDIIAAGRSLFSRRLTPGRTGNISVRCGELMRVTASGSSLGDLAGDDISEVDLAAGTWTGKKPTKEASLHRAIYAVRPDAGAVVHLHSTYAVAVSCLADVDPEAVLPPLTAYFEMRVGRLPLVPFFAPGDQALADAVRSLAVDHHALLLSNHGPVVAGPDLPSAQDAIEEIEETARLYLLLDGRRVRPVPRTPRDPDPTMERSRR